MLVGGNIGTPAISLVSNAIAIPLPSLKSQAFNWKPLKHSVQR